MNKWDTNWASFWSSRFVVYLYRTPPPNTTRSMPWFIAFSWAIKAAPSGRAWRVLNDILEIFALSRSLAAIRLSITSRKQLRKLIYHPKLGSWTARSLADSKCTAARKTLSPWRKCNRLSGRVSRFIDLLTSISVSLPFRKLPSRRPQHRARECKLPYGQLTGEKWKKLAICIILGYRLPLTFQLTTDSTAGHAIITGKPPIPVSLSLVG